MQTKRIVGYADQISVAPGQTVAFKVSCDPGIKDYRARIARVVCGDDQPDGPGLILEPVPAFAATTLPAPSVTGTATDTTPYASSSSTAE